MFISRLSAKSSLEDQTSKPVNYATELWQTNKNLMERWMSNAILVKACYIATIINYDEEVQKLHYLQNNEQWTTCILLWDLQHFISQDVIYKLHIFINYKHGQNIWEKL